MGVSVLVYASSAGAVSVQIVNNKTLTTFFNLFIYPVNSIFLVYPDCFCYNFFMSHWSVDEKQFKKRDPKSYKLWRWVYLISERGLKPGEKIDKRQLKKFDQRLKIRLVPSIGVCQNFFMEKTILTPSQSDFLWVFTKEKELSEFFSNRRNYSF